MTEHIPVMLAEVLEALKPWDSETTVIDATLGLGGHSREILRNCKKCKVIGFDQDPDARSIAAKNLSEFNGRFEIEADNFRHIEKLQGHEDWEGATAVFFDLGVSNLQLTDAERGFSFQEDGPLDMRMDHGDSDNKSLTAEQILAEWSIKDLTEIFRNYGEDHFAYQIAKGIVRNREHGGELHTTGELVELIRKILPAPVQRKMGGHPARKIFQALRIAVNDEMGALDEALNGAEKVLRPEGKIIAISYHSLEDRMVKKRFRKWRDEGIGEPDPRKAIVPSGNEIESNHKSRSAKLRVFVKYAEKKGEALNAL
jgi:16S rRNA (cytosine1402-N4)-methyltransferase